MRDALGDQAETPRYIVGLRGRGYRIVAPVRPVFATRETEAANALHPRRVAGRAVWLTGAVVAATVALAGTLWLLTPTRPTSEPAGANVLAPVCGEFPIYRIDPRDFAVLPDRE